MEFDSFNPNSQPMTIPEALPETGNKMGTFFNQAWDSVQNFFKAFGHAVTPSSSGSQGTTSNSTGNVIASYQPQANESDISSTDFNDSDVNLWRELYEKYWNDTNAYNKWLYEDTKAYNSREAELNREWQKMMQDTYYQRTMEDLRKAGINPLLAFGSIGSASSPSGDSGQVSMSGASANTINPSSMYSSLISKLSSNKQLTGSLISTIARVLGIMAYLVA